MLLSTAEPITAYDVAHRLRETTGQRTTRRTSSRPHRGNNRGTPGVQADSARPWVPPQRAASMPGTFSSRAPCSVAERWSAHRPSAVVDQHTQLDYQGYTPWGSHEPHFDRRSITAPETSLRAARHRHP